MKNILTIDLEFWYSAELIRKYIKKRYKDYPDLIYESTEPILDMLSDYGIKATFFISGEVAAKYPDIIREIKKRKHEIASHSFTHKPLYEMSPQEFESEIIKSIEVINKSVGISPVGFRAPSFSLTEKTKWALQILKRHGFKYDSSIFPIKTHLYGMPDAPIDPYLLDIYNPSIENPKGEILEFPLTVYEIHGIRIPIAGGFYLRFLPLKLIINLYKKLNFTGRVVILYFHPWELFEEIPKINLKFLDRFITYHGIKGMKNKIESIITKFEFQRAIDAVNYYLPH